MTNFNVAADNRGGDPSINRSLMGMRDTYVKGDRHKKDLGLPLTTAEDTFLERPDIEKAEREKGQTHSRASDTSTDFATVFKARLEEHKQKILASEEVPN